MSYISYIIAIFAPLLTFTIVNIKRVETGILSSLDLKFRYLLLHQLIQHMKTLVCVNSFFEIFIFEIKHILYIIEIELLQR